MTADYALLGHNHLALLSRQESLFGTGLLPPASSRDLGHEPPIGIFYLWEWRRDAKWRLEVDSATEAIRQKLRFGELPIQTL